ncbi:hypothetical protein ACM44_07935 [Chryseobacterium koreense CCUG 49689]|uniref:Uncharacterized protein n=1 Tax=Chryseobacterium koreense CCUG 49689 TaxID=1304281 RepID=A0A0J7IZT4_9FLAO|nr:hypothetical protein ACM44_07935 [Chryseobacterium koreense CCUG 49689]
MVRCGGLIKRLVGCRRIWNLKVRKTLFFLVFLTSSCLRIDPIFLDAKFYVLQRTILRRQSLVRCGGLIKRLVGCRRIWNLRRANNIVFPCPFKIIFVCKLI